MKAYKTEAQNAIYDDKKLKLNLKEMNQKLNAKLKEDDSVNYRNDIENENELNSNEPNNGQNNITL